MIKTPPVGCPTFGVFIIFTFNTLMSKALYLLNNINYVYKKRIDGRLKPSIQYQSASSDDALILYDLLI